MVEKKTSAPLLATTLVAMYGASSVVDGKPSLTFQPNNDASSITAKSKADHVLSAPSLRGAGDEEKTDGWMMMKDPSFLGLRNRKGYGARFLRYSTGPTPLPEPTPLTEPTPRSEPTPRPEPTPTQQQTTEATQPTPRPEPTPTQQQTTTTTETTMVPTTMMPPTTMEVTTLRPTTMEMTTLRTTTMVPTTMMPTTTVPTTTTSTPPPPPPPLKFRPVIFCCQFLRSLFGS